MSWLAARRRVHAWQAIDWPVFAVPASLGLVGFAASLAWGATRTWERILWIVLAATFRTQAVLGWRQARRQGWQPRLPEEASADSADAASNQSARHKPNL
jgi:hypothetical protein